MSGARDEELRRLRRRLVEAAWGTVEREVPGPSIPDELSMQSVVDAVLAEIEAAGYRLVPADALGRIGLALWSMMEEEDYTDDILGLEPGDRAAIPGALSGDLDARPGEGVTDAQ